MGIRTTSDLVIGILGSEYGPHPDPTNIDGDLVYPDLTPHIATANAMVDMVVSIDRTTDSQRPHIYSDTTTLEIVERWLAAHFYKVFDQALSSTSKGGGSGSFQNAAKGEGFGFTKYGQQAMALDYSGVLKAIEKGAFAGIKWAGKTINEALSYAQRQGSSS